MCVSVFRATRPGRFGALENWTAKAARKFPAAPPADTVVFPQCADPFTRDRAAASWGIPPSGLARDESFRLTSAAIKAENDFDSHASHPLVPCTCLPSRRSFRAARADTRAAHLHAVSRRRHLR